jgi:hypothetical protein
MVEYITQRKKVDLNLSAHLVTGDFFLRNDFVSSHKFKKCVHFMSQMSKICPFFAILCHYVPAHKNMSIGRKICPVGNPDRLLTTRVANAMRSTVSVFRPKLYHKRLICDLYHLKSTTTATANNSPQHQAA